MRGALIGAYNIGLTMARSVLNIEPWASLEATELVEIMGAATPRLLTMSL